MTGIQMLLKQVGLDPVSVQQTYQQLTTQLPGFLNALGAKVVEIEQALKRIEANQIIIMAKLETNKLEVTNGNGEPTTAVSIRTGGDSRSAA